MQTKEYTEKKDKVIDFLIGFLAIPFAFGVIYGGLMALATYPVHGGGYTSSIATIISTVMGIFSLAAFITPILLIVYLWRRRHFMALGLLYAVVVVPLVLLGTCLLVMLGGGLMSGRHR
jgi:hypothetical protein